MNQTDDVYIKMTETEQKMKELTEAFIKLKKEVFEEIDNLNYIMSDII